MRLKPQRVVICEGEFDRLVLEANGFSAVTSTGGAGSFDSEWADAFADISEVYICFYRDETGRKGALRVGRMIPTRQTGRAARGSGRRRRHNRLLRAPWQKRRSF